MLPTKCLFKFPIIKKWSRQVLIIEQNVSIKERLKQQAIYASILTNKEKAFLVKWKLTVSTILKYTLLNSNTIIKFILIHINKEKEKREMKMKDKLTFRRTIKSKCINYDSNLDRI